MSAFLILVQALLWMMLLKLCYSQNQGCKSEPGSLRLVNGYSELEGRAEVCWNGFWQALCSTTNFDQHANRICGDLGFSKHGVEIQSSDLYSTTGYDITFPDGNYNFTLTHNCRPAALRCQPLICKDWDVRLVGITATEVCINETWIPISPNTHNNTVRVICRQLGSSFYGGQAIRTRLNVSRPVVTVTCSGGETHLSECEDRSDGTSRDQASSITCLQKCHLCKDEPAAVQVRTRGATILTVSWDFANVLPPSSALSYSVTCSPATHTSGLLGTELSVHNIRSNSIELHGVELTQFNHTCCVTAQQEDLERYVLCTTSYTRTELAITVETIVGIVLGSLAVIGGIVVLLIAAGCYRKKRSVENSKKKKREKICASLNDLFSRSGTIPTTPAQADNINRSLREQEAAAKSAESALHEGMLISECVAYTAFVPADQPLPQAYEDVSLTLPASGGAVIIAETSPPSPPPPRKSEPLPPRKDVLQHAYDEVPI